MYFVFKKWIFYNLMTSMFFLLYFGHFCKLIIYLSTNFSVKFDAKFSIILKTKNVKIILPIDRKNSMLVDLSLKGIFNVFPLFSCNEMKNPSS